MSEFRILDYNYMFQSNVTLTASSADSEYPVSNLKNPIRGKVWRSSSSAGNFTITTSNNKIDFNEGGGDLVATITAGTYTATTLAAEIKTRMDAAGTDTYTISYSTTTGRWTISSDGSTLSLLWDTGSNSANTAGDSLGYTTSADDTGATSYVSDNLAIHTEETITIDIGTAENIDSFAMFFDPKASIGVSSAATVKIQANASDVWTSPSVDVTLSLDATYDTYTQYWSSDQSYRYWRIYISDPTNANLYVELPVAYLANAVTLSQSPDLGFLDALADPSVKKENNYGHAYYDVYPIRRTFDMSFTALSASDMESLQEVYRRVGNTEPVVISIDSQAVTFDKDRFTLYGRITGGLDSENLFYNYFTAPSLTVEEAM